jgi:hypothetical protein
MPSMIRVACVPTFVRVAPTPEVPLSYAALRFIGDSTLTGS